MITSDKLRKDAGCWSCQSGEVEKDGDSVSIGCKKGCEVFKQDGWQAAMTCKDYRMKSFDRLYSVQQSRD